MQRTNKRYDETRGWLMAVKNDGVKKTRSALLEHQARQF
jgi:hypothetical protein